MTAIKGNATTEVEPMAQTETEKKLDELYKKAIEALNDYRQFSQKVNPMYYFQADGICKTLSSLHVRVAQTIEIKKRNLSLF